MKEKSLILLRGIPGCGKSTFAELIARNNYPIYSADMYFEKEGEYLFDISKIKDAHNWCIESVEKEMKNEVPIVVVANTFTQSWEMDAYVKLSETYNYNLYSVVVENRHGNVNIHNVPEETIIKMKNRFEVKL